MPVLALLISSSLHPGHPSLQSIIPLAGRNNNGGTTTTVSFLASTDKKGDVDDLGPTMPNESFYRNTNF
jgi:hypothetical protein